MKTAYYKLTDNIGYFMDTDLIRFAVSVNRPNKLYCPFL